jgi:hypothetical protein
MLSDRGMEYVHATGRNGPETVLLQEFIYVGRPENSSPGGWKRLIFEHHPPRSRKIDHRRQLPSPPGDLMKKASIITAPPGA